MRYTLALWWSVISGGGLCLIGGNLALRTDTALAYSGYLAASLGAGIVLVGLLTSVSSPPVPAQLENEKLRLSTQPTQKIAAIRSIAGVILGGLGIVALVETSVPVAYPALAFLIGVAIYVIGLVTLWRNSLTKYYITTDRILVAYQLLKKKERTMPKDHVQGVEVEKSAIGRVVSVGHVKLESAGDTGTSRITARSIDNPQKFAHDIQTALHPNAADGGKRQRG